MIGSSLRTIGCNPFPVNPFHSKMRAQSRDGAMARLGLSGSVLDRRGALAGRKTSAPIGRYQFWPVTGGISCQRFFEAPCSGGGGDLPSSLNAKIGVNCLIFQQATTGAHVGPRFPSKGMLSYCGTRIPRPAKSLITASANCSGLQPVVDKWISGASGAS